MYNLADAVRNIAILISSMMPFTAPKIFAQLGLETPEQFDLDDVAWGNFPDGTKVAKGQPIFPRIEEECRSSTFPSSNVVVTYGSPE